MDVIGQKTVHNLIEDILTLLSISENSGRNIENLDGRNVKKMQNLC